jgi:hypothetical protein
VIRKTQQKKKKKKKILCSQNQPFQYFKDLTNDGLGLPTKYKNTEMRKSDLKRGQMREQ